MCWCVSCLVDRNTSTILSLPPPSFLRSLRTFCKHALRKLRVLSYRVGKTWGKDIVSDKWLEASVAANHCKDPAAYDLEPSRMVDAPTSRSAVTTTVHFAIC